MTEPPRPAASAAHRLIFVTGPSGAGRSTAIKALEDLGFEAIDNMPLSLLPRLLDGPPIGRPLALGLDVRNRDFSVSAILELTEELDDAPGLGAELLFLDCRADVLLRRFSETRRRHPLAPGDAPGIGIDREIELLSPLRDRAAVLIDTTDLTPHDLRAELQKWYAPEKGGHLSVHVESFSYKRGVPRGVDMVFDCRFLANPHWQEDLRPLDGRDPRVAAYVEADPRCGPFVDQVTALAEFLLPAFSEEGKSHLTIGFGCTGGQHRSVAMAEKLGNTLAKAGWQVSKRHRELERRARSAPPNVQG